jgi:hypothetical protein
MKIILKLSISILVCISFLNAFPRPGETPENFTRYHYQLDKEWTLYDYLDGNTVILLITGSFT